MKLSDTNLERNPSITVFCYENNAFNRNFLALVKHWDRHGKINILPSQKGGNQLTDSAIPSAQSSLLLVDENGERWNGAEAVPIIFKNLPFGKLAAAMYTLPGTMWLTKQFCETDSAR